VWRVVLALVLGLAAGGSATAAPTVGDFFKPAAYDFWTRVETFLEKNLRDAAPQ
jgi:hypothetical protein